MTEPENLTEQVRRWIREDGRSVNQLARDAGMHQPTLQQFLTGRSKGINSSLLGPLLDALGAEVKPPKKAKQKKNT